MKRELIMAEVFRTAWAIEPAYGERVLAMLGKWSRGESASDADIEAARATRDARTARQSGSRAVRGIAVLPLYGTIAPRANLLMEYSGGTSCQLFGSLLREAVNDESVGQILIDIDSPGGNVAGVQELASEIMQARTQKPIIGIANHLAASAAYWLGSCCTELYASPSAEVGSIGVWTAHQDLSDAYAAAGVKTTLISAGKYKTEGNEFGPLAAEAKAFMQDTVDGYYRAFVAAVARGRGVSVEKVRSGMGQGRCLMADDAKAQGMVDGIISFAALVNDLQARPRSTKSAGSRGNAAALGRIAAMRREIDILSL